MRRISIVMFACAGLVLFASHAFAQRGNGGSKPKPPTASKPTTTVKPQGSAPKAPSSKPVKASPSPGPKKTTVPAGAGAKTTASKPVAGSKAGSGKASTDTTTAAKSAKKTSPTSSTTPGTTTSTDGTPGTTDIPLTPVQQKLQRNTKLADKLQGRLPMGTDLMTAAEGFRNLGQLVAAANVSYNLGIPFTELKASMVDDGLSLGQAIQKSKTISDPFVQAQRAEADAQRLIAESEPSQPTSSSTTPTTKAKKRTQGGNR